MKVHITLPILNWFPFKPLHSAKSSKSFIGNGAFSNWEKYKTDSRKRTQDPISGEWFWEIENVSDADTPNINQIDIPINPGEKIEIKIRSLSEVGWPETPVESEWSNTLEIIFPDDLNSVLNEDEFILWLAGFIERMTIGGKEKLPPISNYIPKGFKIDQAEIPVAAEPSKEENAEMIINYFKSEDFIKNNKISS